MRYCISLLPHQPSSRSLFAECRLDFILFYFFCWSIFPFVFYFIMISINIECGAIFECQHRYSMDFYMFHYYHGSSRQTFGPIFLPSSFVSVTEWSGNHFIRIAHWNWGHSDERGPWRCEADHCSVFDSFAGVHN